MNKKHDIEIESLNLESLDVEELEHRLEMTVAAPSVCYSNSCGTRVVTCGTLSISEA